MPLSIGSNKSQYGSEAQVDRARARNRVISEMRVLVDNDLRKSDLERRKMEKAVAELRRKNTY